jgi:hypothetical protein
VGGEADAHKCEPSRGLQRARPRDIRRLSPEQCPRHAVHNASRAWPRFALHARSSTPRTAPCKSSFHAVPPALSHTARSGAGFDLVGRLRARGGCCAALCDTTWGSQTFCCSNLSGAPVKLGSETRCFTPALCSHPPATQVLAIQPLAYATRCPRCGGADA